MNTSKLFSLRNLALTAMSLVAMIFAMSDAKAQEVFPRTISTEINNLSATSFPLVVETNYEAGVQPSVHHSNGVFEEPALQGLGQAQAVTVNGLRVKVGETGTLPDPSGTSIIIIVYWDSDKGTLVIIIKA